MIISYPPTMRRQLLSKHFLISTMRERALDDLVKFSTVIRFEQHRDVFNKGEPGASVSTVRHCRRPKTCTEADRLRSLCWLEFAPELPKSRHGIRTFV